MGGGRGAGEQQQADVEYKVRRQQQEDDGQREREQLEADEQRRIAAEEAEQQRQRDIEADWAVEDDETSGGSGTGL
jgi:hypothetical protein